MSHVLRVGLPGPSLLNIAPGCKLLDVACGSGQLALMAAKDNFEVTGVDIAGNLVQRAQARAQAEGLKVRFQEADAGALPFDDARFDVVVSLLGAMFALRPDHVAKELLRVCAPGGTIAMVNWTPQGFIGQMFKTIAKFIAPSGMPSPVLWGDGPPVRVRLGHGLSQLSLTRRHYLFSYPFPPTEVVEFFRRYYGPINQALPRSTTRGKRGLALSKVILESLALRYAEIVVRLGELTGRPVAGIHVVGGGSQDDFLAQATADAAGLPLQAGPVEATAIGNLLVQAIHDGRFADLTAARAFVAAQSPPRRFAPVAPAAWEAARARFQQIRASTQPR